MKRGIGGNPRRSGGNSRMKSSRYVATSAVSVPGDPPKDTKSVPSFVPSFALGRAVSGWDTLFKTVQAGHAETASDLLRCVHSAPNGTVQNFRFVQFLNRVSQVRILPRAQMAEAARSFSTDDFVFDPSAGSSEPLIGSVAPGVPGGVERGARDDPDHRPGCGRIDRRRTSRAAPPDGRRRPRSGAESNGGRTVARGAPHHGRKPVLRS